MKLVVPERSAMRLWKFKLLDGRVVRRGVGCEKRLKKILKEFVPENVWYGVSEWLNVLDVRERGAMKSSTALIGTEFVVDIDGEYSLNGLEKARLVALEVIKRLGVPKNIRFTGNRGFHLIYGRNSVEEMNWRRRERVMVEKAKLFIKQLPKDKTIDKKITTNLRLEETLPGTARKTGWISQEISYEQQKTPI